MRIDIKRASAPRRAESIKMAVQFLFDPFAIQLDQGDEIKVGVKQLGKILFRIVAVIGNKLRSGYAGHLQSLQGISDGDDIRLVAWLFCESDRLPGLNQIE